jgi:hypothetical protein
LPSARRAFVRKRHFVEIAAVLRAFFTVFRRGLRTRIAALDQHIFGAAAASVFRYPHPVEMNVLISQPKSSQNGKVDATGYGNVISNYDPATFCNL